MTEGLSRVVVEYTSLIPRLSCGGGGKRAWCSLFVHAPSSLGNLHTTLLHYNFCLPAERLRCRDNYTPYETCMSCFEVITLTVCIASFEVIAELQGEKLCQSRAAAFN